MPHLRKALATSPSSSRTLPGKIMDLQAAVTSSSHQAAGATGAEAACRICTGRSK